MEFTKETLIFFEERFKLASERLSEIRSECKDLMDDGKAEAIHEYFYTLCDHAAMISGNYIPVRNGDYELLSSDNKAKYNIRFYADVLGENYSRSFADPAYACKRLGNKSGKLLSSVYYEMLMKLPLVFTGDLWELTVFFELVLEIYGLMTDNSPEYEDEGIRAQAVKKAIYYYHHDYCFDFTRLSQYHYRSPEGNLLNDKLKNADLSDISFLYGYGEYVHAHQKEVFGYLNSLSEERLEGIVSTFVDGYVRGFENQKMDFASRKIIDLRYQMGFERIIKRAQEKFESMGKKCVVVLTREAANRQCEYDHRNDNVLWLDERFKNLSCEAFEAACKELKEEMGVYGGPAVLEAFGEPDFTPANNEFSLSPSEEQRKLSAELTAGRMEILCRYIDMEKRSFTIMALPLPTICEGRKDLDYSVIFDEIIKVNTLDNFKYQKLQQTIIDILDSGTHVAVKGKGGNRTDIKVMLHRLNDPAKETNFENCTADVNIPVGEVFTSPVLGGTNGILNVSRAFLNGFEFKNLCLSFENGMIKDYSCDNFKNEKENRDYIREKILFNHDSLPIGEFAIGTNTTAYALANRFDIWDKLPILIAEKTGPHFAVGDTCYSDFEDFMTYNPDGKAIIARENEVSALRKTDRSKAYFQCHTDITIPYDELEYIRVVREDGSTASIIEDGRFTFPGAEELNKALD